MPSVAKTEDVEELLEVMRLRRYAKAWALVNHPDFDEEMLERAGVSKAMVDEVFAVMEHTRGRR